MTALALIYAAFAPGSVVSADEMTSALESAELNGIVEWFDARSAEGKAVTLVPGSDAGLWSVLVDGAPAELVCDYECELTDLILEEIRDRCVWDLAGGIEGEDPDSY